MSQGHREAKIQVEGPVRLYKAEKCPEQMVLRSSSLGARTRMRVWMLDRCGKWQSRPQECRSLLNTRRGTSGAIFVAWEAEAMKIKTMFHQMPKEEVAKADQAPEIVEKCHD